MHPDAYAVEAGPEAARYVGSLLHRPDRVAIMAARMKTHPNNMAFLDMREENDLAARCSAASRNPHFHLWGLDQEFAGSAGTLLEAMAVATYRRPDLDCSHCSGPGKGAGAGHQEALRAGDPSKLFMLASTMRIYRRSRRRSTRMAMRPRRNF